MIALTTRMEMARQTTVSRVKNAETLACIVSFASRRPSRSPCTCRVPRKRMYRSKTVVIDPPEILANRRAATPENAMTLTTSIRTIARIAPASMVKWRHPAVAGST